MTENSTPNKTTENLPLGHIKARTEQPKGYPQRFFVPENTTWNNVDIENYAPADYTSQKVIENDMTRDPNNPNLWADPVDPKAVDHSFEGYEGTPKIDTDGRPLNLRGPTGLRGRGLLGKWGPNFAADAIVTTTSKTGELRMIAIKRSDTGEYAIPGGMINKGETVIQALERELKEETDADLNFENASLVYNGYVDDPRNTDNAWMETGAHHLHLENTDNTTLKAGDDAVEVKWPVVSQDFIESLYASHGETLKLALQLWQKKNHKTIDKDGFVKEV
jgi:ADP-ribose pyrophosphatase